MAKSRCPLSVANGVDFFGTELYKIGCRIPNTLVNLSPVSLVLLVGHNQAVSANLLRQESVSCLSLNLHSLGWCCRAP